MPGVSRQGDTNQAGGAIMRGASSVFVNGIPVGLHVSQITNHAPYGKRTERHRAAVTTSACESVFAEGSQVLKIGSGNSCGHSIVGGSSDVNVP